ncbi:unnamed protein product [Didymodactylos carnosus]|uniref:WWE domain-containing protein n=1 Tax=Didymodactylos carnosus TaxID=1234261 RepID=A0A8S2HBZ6_9BILA|nr:unnamed protein product [Didymodactylos carnosus]CAF3626666.1 unnamed protein product [Didymodactylos carnosus]
MVEESNGIPTVVWYWQSNENPWLETETPVWTSYSSDCSDLIEYAFNSNKNQIKINSNYIVDLKENVQVNVNDNSKQRPVKRCLTLDECKKSVRTNMFCEQSPLLRSLDEDTMYHGSKYITDWFINFTRGKLKIDSIHSIVQATIDGILEEGRNEGKEDEAEEMVNELSKYKNCKGIDELLLCCAKLYTKDAFLFRSVNKALGSDDRTKFHTLGPFCYLLYNYTGHGTKRTASKSSISQFVDKLFEAKLKKHLNDTILVYRGGSLSDTLLQKYQRAVGHGHWKWPTFVSTRRCIINTSVFG